MLGQPRQNDGSRVSITSLTGKKTGKKESISRAGFGSSNVSLLGIHRGSIAFKTGKGGFKVPRYQNTYQLESSNPFSAAVIDKILENVLENTLRDVKIYDSKGCMKLCQDMVMEIREQIYKKNYHRYKYIVTVTIIQKARQGMNIGIGCIWNTERDNYSTYVFENLQYYAIAIVAGFYYN